MYPFWGDPVRRTRAAGARNKREGGHDNPDFTPSPDTHAAPPWVTG